MAGDVVWLVGEAQVTSTSLSCLPVSQSRQPLLGSSPCWCVGARILCWRGRDVLPLLRCWIVQHNGCPAWRGSIILPHLHSLLHQGWSCGTIHAGPGHPYRGRRSGPPPSHIARCRFPLYDMKAMPPSVRPGEGGRSNPEDLACLMTLCMSPDRFRSPFHRALLYWGWYTIV